MGAKLADHVLRHYSGRPHKKLVLAICASLFDDYGVGNLNLMSKIAKLSQLPERAVESTIDSLIAEGVMRPDIEDSLNIITAALPGNYGPLFDRLDRLKDKSGTIQYRDSQIKAIKSALAKGPVDAPPLSGRERSSNP